MEALFGKKRECPKWHTADSLDYALLKTNARNNRKAMTVAECCFWQYACSSGLGEKCRRQYVIGNYIVDFFFRESLVVVEIDGGYHLDPEQKEKDEVRQKWLEEKGYAVLRFTNEQILNDIENVITIIRRHISAAKSSL